ncbi:hypothetical protein SB748_11845 [Rhizobium sp. SIMBA_035]
MPIIIAAVADGSDVRACKARAPQNIAISTEDPVFSTAPTMERRVIVTPGLRLTRSNSFTFRPTGITEGLPALSCCPASGPFLVFG